MLRFAVLATLLVIAAATDFRACENKINPIGVRVEGCDKAPCNVVKGKNAVIEMDFVTKSKAKALTAKVVATAFGIKVPYPLPENLGDVCKNLLNDAYCPLDAEEDATYKLVFPVGTSYPEIPVTIETSIVDEEGKVQSCFALDIQVKSN